VSAALPGAQEFNATVQARFRYLLRLGDLSLVLGQRLGEWVGHSPALEEDLGLANIALDLIGQARLLLTYAGEVEGRGRGEDDIAFLREHGEYLNAILAEQPNGDFGRTIVRQVLIDAFQLELYQRMTASTDERLAAIAAKSVKEVLYHLRYSSGWLVRLGDGTAEIPAAHAELDRNVALAALAIDKGSPGVERDVRKLAKRNVAIGARRSLITDFDGADGVDAASIFGIEPDCQTELPVAFEHRRHGCPAEGGLHHRVHVAGI